MIEDFEGFGNFSEECKVVYSINREVEIEPIIIEDTRDNYVQLLAEDIGEYADEMAEVLPYDAITRDQYFIVDQKGEAKGSLNAAYSAMWFSYSHFVWSRYMASQARPCYEYYFTKTNSRLSNHHAGELPYAYGNLGSHPDSYTDDDYALSEIMQSYWVNFAKNGDPNGAGLPEWPMITGEQSLLLNLDSEVKTMEDPNLKLYEVIDRYMDSQ